ncbi:MAG: hypothetical protein O3A46_06985 [Candidatus Poribacteria bacterium]|nr:hypothetical protein [Candidatus Poribacteria bacterium]
MNILPDDLLKRLERQAESAGESIRALRQTIESLENDRARLEQEQDALVQRTRELQDEIKRLFHLEGENTDLRLRHEQFVHQVETLLAHLKGNADDSE